MFLVQNFRMKTQKIESKKLAVPLESLNLWIRSQR